MKRYFRMICEDKEGNKNCSQWFDLELTNIFNLMDRYNIAIKKYQLICNIEYMEDLKK